MSYRADDLDEIDPMMRGYKISVSFSCPSELLDGIREYQGITRYNLSQAVCKLVRLGYTYSKLLAQQKLEREQAALEQPQPTVSADSIAAKPKTRSKTKKK